MTPTKPIQATKNCSPPFSIPPNLCKNIRSKTVFFVISAIPEAKYNCRKMIISNSKIVPYKRILSDFGNNSFGGGPKNHQHYKF